jgi:MFS family permease
MVLMNIVYALSAYPFGHMSDHISRYRLLAYGLVMLLAADLALAVDGHWSILLLGIVLWGLHMGLTQGILAALVADTAPDDLHGTAFGFFNLASGVAMLIASVVAGWLWDSFGASATFLAGAGFCGATLLLLALNSKSGQS